LGDGRWVFGFHTWPAEAARLRREPGRWSAIVRQAPHLTELLGEPIFCPGMVFQDARGRALPSPVGDRWVACGDAAICFDPVAGQGILNALRSGMAASRHIVSAGTGRIANDYTDEIADVAAIYDERRRRLYGAQVRWPEAPFWRFQGQRARDPAPSFEDAR
jgi:flavin-dependent dehydrogenase